MNHETPLYAAWLGRALRSLPAPLQVALDLVQQEGHPFRIDPHWLGATTGRSSDGRDAFALVVNVNPEVPRGFSDAALALLYRGGCELSHRNADGGDHAHARVEAPVLAPLTEPEAAAAGLAATSVVELGVLRGLHDRAQTLTFDAHLALREALETRSAAVRFTAEGALAWLGNVRHGRAQQAAQALRAEGFVRHRPGDRRPDDGLAGHAYLLPWPRAGAPGAAP